MVNKKMLVIQLLREVFASKGGFISIVLMTFVSTAMFTGVYSITPSMQNATNDILTKQKMYDIKVMNKDGFTANDIHDIQSSNRGIVEGRNTYDAYVVSSDENRVVSSIISETEANKPKIIEGRNITNANECLVNEANHQLLNQQIVIDKITSQQSCQVVGTAQVPDHYSETSLGNSPLGNGQVKLVAIVDEEFSFLQSQNPGGERRYSEVVIQLDSAPADVFTKEYEAYVNSYRDELEKEHPDYFVQTLLDNSALATFKDDSNKIANIGAIFPIIFMAVSILVVITTMTRLVEDHRFMIGTYKSLGYSSNSLLMYYGGYIMIPSIIGALMGAIFGNFVFPNIVIQSYSGIYNIESGRALIVPNIIALSLLLTIGTLFVVTMVTVYRTIKEKPASLFRPIAPVAGKKVLLERISFIWKRLSFINKVTFRNIFRYKKRLMMTIVGIAGSSAILVTAIGLYTSVHPISSKQFDDVVNYDFTVYNKTENGDASAVNKFDELTNVEKSIAINQTQIDIENTEMETTLVVPESTEINGFINFNKINNYFNYEKPPIEFTEDSVMITQKLAETLKVRSGDLVTFAIGDQTYSTRITDVVENYVNHYIYMSKQQFEKIVGEVTYNAGYVKLNEGLTAGEISDTAKVINADNNTQAVINKSDVMETSSESVKSVNSVVFLMIGFALFLIVIVVYNLNSINIVERNREIATIKVLGFTQREVITYVFKESVISTSAAAIIGLIIGIPIHMSIITRAELDHLMFIREIPIMVYIFTLFATVLISAVTMFIMKETINKIDMISSLKSVE